MAKHQNNTNNSRIDLTKLRPRELKELRDRINGELAEIASMFLGEQDAVLEYSVTLRTAAGVVSNNQGTVQFSKLLHPRLITTAPGLVEESMRHHVLTPLNADLFDALEQSSPQPGRSLNASRQHTTKNLSLVADSTIEIADFD